MFTPAEIFAANHPPDGECSHLTKQAILRDFYDVDVRHWQRICSGECEIHRQLANRLLDRYRTLYPSMGNVPVPFICQTLRSGVLTIRVHPADAARFAEQFHLDLSAAA